MYCWLVCGLAAILAAAICFNLYYKYEISALITVIATVIGPWGAIFLDPIILHGDFVPIIYITLSIQLCAILLPVLPTVIIGAFQLAVLALCIQLNDGLSQINWPSLMAFIVATSAISIVASVLYRKQYDEIIKQKEQLLQDECQLREIAVRDSLTGLYNRRFMTSSLKKEIDKAACNHLSVGVIIIDVDNYKTINDNYGHVLGDHILTQIAQIFTDNLRISDVICRYGGDEFVLVLPNSTLASTLHKAEELRQTAASASFTFEGVTLGITLSFGAAAYPQHGKTGEALLKAADRALYTAKKNGRNRVSSIPV